MKKNINQILQISHISLFTNNLNKVIKFYVNFLGFKVVHTFKNKKNQKYGLFIYCGNNTMLEFFYTKKKISHSSKFRHICFQVSNINKIFKKLSKKNTTLSLKRGRTDKTLNFEIKDLENNIIEFHQYDKKSKLFKKLK